MKYIEQQHSPHSFENWKRNNTTANWSGFSGTYEYKTVKKQLINQQKQMCGYCEIFIKEDNESSHIDHLKDKHTYPEETFNFNNLLASCQHTDSCGHKKGNNYFHGFISPFDKNCQNRFTYTLNGRVIPTNENDTDARKTIDILGLNCKRLIDRRKGIIKTLEQSGNDYVQQSLQNCIEWFDGFYTVIEYMLNKNTTD